MSAEQDRANRSSTHAASPAEGRQRSGFVVLPVAIFFGLAIMFAFALFSGDPSKLPSALIGRPAPQVDFAPLREGLLDYIDGLWTAEGGFHGSWGDDDLDIEYTYYGLLALGHLAI